MRKGFNGLFGLVRDRLQCEPLSGHVFLFCNGQRNRLKLVFWDGSGLWVCAKRLEKGKFRWPEVNGDQNKVQLSQEELALLLGGIDLRQVKRRQWYRRGVEPGVSTSEVQAERGREPLPARPVEKKVARHPGRQALPAELPRVERVSACTAEQCVCGSCGRATTVIGYEESEQLDV